MKIGFFGGSFNPPTNAHVCLAKKALIECKLDKVIFVPMGDFYQKKGLVLAKHRYNMLKIICDKQENLEVSDIELYLNKQMHAIDAFKLIENKYRQDDIYFIMGADNFVNITKWKDSKELLEKYKYIVLGRENIDINKYINENCILDFNKIRMIENEEFKNHSSTKARNTLSLKKTYDKDMVPKEILEYIALNNLYND